MAKNFKKTAIKTEKKFKKSDFSVIAARSKATKQSRKRKCVYIGLLRYARNDG